MIRYSCHCVIYRQKSVIAGYLVLESDKHIMAISVDNSLKQFKLSARKFSRGRTSDRFAVLKHEQTDQSKKTAFSRPRKSGFSSEFQKEQIRDKAKFKQNRKLRYNAHGHHGHNIATDHENRNAQQKSTALGQASEGGIKKSSSTSEHTDKLTPENQQQADSGRVDKLIPTHSSGLQPLGHEMQPLLSSSMGKNTATVNSMNVLQVSKDSATGSVAVSAGLKGNDLPFATIGLITEESLAPPGKSGSDMDQTAQRLNLMHQQLMGSEVRQSPQQGIEKLASTHLTAEDLQQVPLQTLLSKNRTNDLHGNLDELTLLQLSDKNTIGVKSVTAGSQAGSLHLLAQQLQQSQDPTAGLTLAPGLISSRSDQASGLSGLLMPSVLAHTTTDSQAALTYQLGRNIHSPAWSASFVKNIAQMALNNRNLAELRLDPPDLGSIMVKIHQQSGDAMIQFHVQNADTRTAVENSLFRLKEALAQQGFSQVNVDVQQQFSSHSQGHSSDSEMQNSMGSLRSSTFQDGAINGAVAENETVLSVTHHNHQTASGIDLFA